MKIQLKVVEGTPRGQLLRFPTGEYVFGWGPECHVRPRSEWISRQHCLLRISEQGVHVKDLGSTTGTLVNGARVMEECPLREGDQMQVGPLVFQLMKAG